jgi:hypothetical protein
MAAIRPFVATTCRSHVRKSPLFRHVVSHTAGFQVPLCEAGRDLGRGCAVSEYPFSKTLPHRSNQPGLLHTISGFYPSLGTHYSSLVTRYCLRGNSPHPPPRPLPSRQSAGTAAKFRPFLPAFRGSVFKVPLCEAGRDCRRRGWGLENQKASGPSAQRFSLCTLYSELCTTLRPHPPPSAAQWRRTGRRPPRSHPR